MMLVLRAPKKVLNATLFQHLPKGLGRKVVHDNEVPQGMRAGIRTIAGVWVQLE